MILFFKNQKNQIFIVECSQKIENKDISKMSWAFDNAEQILVEKLDGTFFGPRKEMITPWSTNAVEIVQNMGISNVVRIETFEIFDKNSSFDPMLQAKYHNPGQDVFTINHDPEPIRHIENIEKYNNEEGLALSSDEVEYLEGVSKKIKRSLTDSEVYGFAQVNSEHCRHKIFNGKFIIDGEEKTDSLFALIKKTSKVHSKYLVSAYKDNVAFICGPKAEQFAPSTQDKADFFEIRDINSIISIKAETHNFPTTVEPFNGAATGSGGEIRDRMAGGKGSMPIAGTAVYMTSYPRIGEGRDWEKMPARPWLYQSPEQILIKASNGASDFGNKFGQPLICGSLMTFEHEGEKHFGYDKVIMMAGGVGYGSAEDSEKDIPEIGDIIVLLGGDNYRIGMGGGAVSSVATGEFDNDIELNAVQRANPEMQKRVCNAVRAMAETTKNPIVSIHDHGAGGHLNCLSELVEETGGEIDMSQLPVGDPTLSAKEIAGNESQERMGLVIKAKDVDILEKVANRERSPFYKIGKITGDMNFSFKQADGKTPLNLQLEDMFGKPPKTILEDKTSPNIFEEINYSNNKFDYYLEQLLQLESVACKDWLTNKVDRSVTGKIAKQQCAGNLQLPLNNVGVVALDYQGEKGIATSIGHASAPALIDAAAGSRLSIAESLTNLIWAPLSLGLPGVSLSANWMWPAKNPGENARLFEAVEAVSDFSIELGINVPTGKDSLSMTQKYPDGKTVFSPGTVIITSVGEVSDIKKVVEPVLQKDENSSLFYIDLSKSEKALGGSAFAQILNSMGTKTPDVSDAKYFAKAFKSIQQLINENLIIAGHDISSGGLITTLLEMTFSTENLSLDIDLSLLNEKDDIKLLFSENPGVIIQVSDCKKAVAILENSQIDYNIIGKQISGTELIIKTKNGTKSLDIVKLRDLWFSTSYLFDKKQCGEKLAKTRFEEYKNNSLKFNFPEDFTGKLSKYNLLKSRREASGVKAAIIREKGVNGDREMAWSLYLAGFDVKDVHMTDLISGREDLSDVNMIVFVGGFSNSDVLGSAKGWAGVFKYNEKAQIALKNFFSRKDTLSLGICNGCQLMVELDLIYPEHKTRAKMEHNDSKKFEAGFVNVDILENNSIMLKSLAGSRLGVWVAHGEGKYELPMDEKFYKIPVKYSYKNYPANPNGSDYNSAAICSEDGRHLAMMPHLERAVYPWQWAMYPNKNDEITPWLEAFVNAKIWIKEQIANNL